MNINILLATYNGAKYIEEQLDSIFNQDLPNGYKINVFLSDDSSKDDTVSIVKNNYSQVNILSTDRKGGVINNFKYLIDNCSDGDLYFFCDQDDVWKKDKLLKFISVFDSKKQNPILIHSDLSVVDAELNIICDSMFEYQGLNKNPSFENLLISNSITGCVCAINHELISILRKIPFSDIIMHDWFIALICSSKGEIIFVDEPTIYYRQHGGNQVGAKNKNILQTLIHSKINFGSISEAIRLTVRQAIVLEPFVNEIVCRDYLKASQGGILDRIKFILHYPGVRKNNWFKTIVFRILFLLLK
ncbi:TPA: glycosyltransferase family 2 protein [Photobacterium damselae]